jgi:hypothetical protein
MRAPRRLLTLMAGALLFAAAIMLLVSAPGFLSDRDSTVSSHHIAEVGR